MSTKPYLTVGVITELKGNNISVKLTQIPGQPTIQAYVKGKMRKSNIKLTELDPVQIEISEDSPNLGRIVRRLKTTDAQS